MAPSTTLPGSPVGPATPAYDVTLKLSEMTDGLFLVYTTVAGGSLKGLWSKTPPTSAGSLLAFAKPSKPVPEFKYKQRQDIATNVDQSKTTYFNGWINFIRTAKQNGAKICFLAGVNDYMPVGVYFGDSKNTVEQLSANRWIDTSSKGSVVVCLASQTALKGILTMAPDQLVSVGRASSQGEGMII